MSQVPDSWIDQKALYKYRVITITNIGSYFRTESNPFYEREDNLNEILIQRGARPDQNWATNKEIRQLKGIEYIYEEYRIPNAPPTITYLLAHKRRRDTAESVTHLETYICISGEVFPAPLIRDLIQQKLLKVSHLLLSSFESIIDESLENDYKYLKRLNERGGYQVE